MIAGETATSVTLRRQEGKEDVLLRTDIEAMAGSGQSLMPEGVEKDLPPQSIADLIAFLKTTGPPPKSIAGNHPERVRPGPDGAIVLRAETAEISGETLTFESQHGNLGFWSAKNDRAAWRFDVLRARPLHRLARLGLRRPHRRQHARPRGRQGAARNQGRPAPGAGRRTARRRSARSPWSDGPQRLEISPAGRSAGPCSTSARSSSRPK